MGEKAYWLKMQRKKRGLSQQELARLSGVSLRSIRAYEQGTRDIRGASVELVQKLCSVLGCTPREILSYPGGRENPFGQWPGEKLREAYRELVLRETVSPEIHSLWFGEYELSELLRLLTEEMAWRYYREI